MVGCDVGLSDEVGDEWLWDRKLIREFADN